MKNLLDISLEAIRNYVDTVHGGKTAPAARSLDIGNQTLWQWLNGKRKPKLSAIAPVLEKLNLDFSIQGVSDSKRNMKEIAIYDVAGAGPAVDIHEIEPLTSIIMPKNFIPACDFGVQIQGHSMEPTITNNAIVGIKTNVPFMANELYLASIPYEGRVVKRVGVDQNTKEFIFKSDNPDKERYPEFRLNIDESNNILIGKVVWILKR